MLLSFQFTQNGGYARKDFFRNYFMDITYKTNSKLCRLIAWTNRNKAQKLLVCEIFSEFNADFRKKALIQKPFRKVSGILGILWSIK